MEQKRTGFLQFVKNCLNCPGYNKALSGKKRVVAEMKDLFLFLAKHYSLRDIEERRRKNCRHWLRFTLLYMERSDMSFFEIADDMFIDLHKDTFKYYVRKYNEDVLEWFTLESNVNSVYALILREYRKTLKS